MLVVIAGGTGFIGRKLARALVDRGDEVTLLSRTAAPPAEGVRTVAWDPRPGGDLAWTRTIDGAGAVVNLAGAGVVDERWTDARLALIRSSRVDSTDALVRAIDRAERRPRVLVSASGVGIYGMRKDDTILGEDGDHGTDVLASLCEDWEAAALRAEESCRVAVSRFGVVLGADGGALARMVPLFRRFLGGPIGDGQQWWSWIHWRDAVRALLFAIDEDALRGPFNVTAPEPVTMNEVARALGEVLHRPAVWRVPAFSLRLALGDAAEVILTGQRVVPRRLQELGFRFEHPDFTAALRDAVRS